MRSFRSTINRKLKRKKTCYERPPDSGNNNTRGSMVYIWWESMSRSVSWWISVWIRLFYSFLFRIFPNVCLLLFLFCWLVFFIRVWVSNRMYVKESIARRDRFALYCPSYGYHKNKTEQTIKKGEQRENIKTTSNTPTNKEPMRWEFFLKLIRGAHSVVHIFLEVNMHIFIYSVLDADWFEPRPKWFFPPRIF